MAFISLIQGFRFEWLMSRLHNSSPMVDCSVFQARSGPSSFHARLKHPRRSSSLVASESVTLHAVSCFVAASTTSRSIEPEARPTTPKRMVLGTSCSLFCALSGFTGSSPIEILVESFRNDRCHALTLGPRLVGIADGRVGIGIQMDRVRSDAARLSISKSNCGALGVEPTQEAFLHSEPSTTFWRSRA